MGEETAKVIALATARISPKERARVEFEEREAGAGKVKLYTRWDAIKWGDGWMERALRSEHLLNRANMLLFCEEVNCKASDLLLEAAYAELERVKGMI